MATKRDLEIVAAGHTCLDLIPAFTIDGKVDKMTDVLVPGKMINMGECVVVGGGPVTNAGVSIRRLGVKTELIGKIGNDDFGKQILRWYEEHKAISRASRQSTGSRPRTLSRSAYRGSIASISIIAARTTRSATRT